MRERHCVICGAPFPANAPASKKYCDSCREARERERYIIQKEEQKRRRAEAPPLPTKPFAPPRTLQKKDEDYCRRCVYKGRFSAGYLCDYYSMTGERRGTKAGFGCERRKIATKETGKRVCERCGVEITSRYSRFCADCRIEFHREAALHMAEVLRERRKNEKERK